MTSIPGRLIRGFITPTQVSAASAKDIIDSRGQRNPYIQYLGWLPVSPGVHSYQDQYD